MTALRQRAVLATTVPVTLRTFHTGTVRALQRDGYDVTLVSSPGSDLDRAAAVTNSPAVALFMARGLTPASDVRALWSWVRMLRRIRPRLVVAGTPKCALLAMVAAALQRVERRIYICGGLRLEGEAGWRRTVLATMERIAMAAATEVVVNSRSLLDEVGWLVDKSKVRQTLPGSSHGVDSEHFAPREPDRALLASLGLDPDLPVLGFVGRLTRDKGVDTLIEAARMDGAGILRTYGSVVLPVSMPGFVVVLIWQFTSAWNDYLFAAFFSSGRNGPVTIALSFLAGGQLTDYAASMAGALIASVPTLIVYILLGKYFVGGLMSGSVKG